jgi:hypothetical protein
MGEQWNARTSLGDEPRIDVGDDDAVIQASEKPAQEQTALSSVLQIEGGMCDIELRVHLGLVAGAPWNAG